MKPLKLSGILLCVLLLLFSSRSASAFYNNYQYLIGDRAAGMGGAYAALANDSTALWYNPSGLANIKHSSLNVSGNSYNYFNKTTAGYEEFENKSGEYQSADLTVKDVSIVANTVAFGFNIGDKQALAFGIFVPFQTNLTGKIDSEVDGPVYETKNQYNTYINEKFYTAMVGYGVGVTDWLNIGVSAGLGFWKFVNESHDRFYVDDGSDKSYMSTYERDDSKEYTLHGGVGMQIKPTVNHTLGLYFQTPLYRLSGTYSNKTSEWAIGPAFDEGAETTTTRAKDDKWGKIMPASVSVGYSYESPGSWAFSVEAVPLFKSESARRRIVNYRAGMELYLTDALILRGGFFTDLSQEKDVTATSESDEKIDYFGGCLSITVLSQSASSDGKSTSKFWTTVGMIHREGRGDVQVTRYDKNFNDSTIVKKQKISSTSMFISETVAF